MAKKTEQKIVIKAVDKTARTLGGISKRMQRLGSSISRVGQGMTMGLTAPIAAFGAVTLRAAGNYESSMKRVEALTGATGESLAALQETAKHLGRTTQYSASQAAQGMGFLAQAGFKAHDIVASMPGVLSLAAAGQLELADAASITATTLRGYGMKADQAGRVADVLANASVSANQTVGDLGDAFSYVGGTAANLGYEFEEVAAALTLIADSGKEGSRGGTALLSAIADMANEGGEAYAKMQELGMSMQDATGKVKPMIEVVREMEAAGIDAGDAIDIFGKRAGPALADLLGKGSASLGTMTEKMRNSGGVADTIASKQMEGLKGSLLLLKSAFEGLQIAIAESGLMTWVTNFITRVAGWISTAATASKSTITFALKIAGIVAAVGPVLFIIGKLIAMIGFLTSPIGWVVTAIGVLLAAWKRWGDDIRQILAPVLNWITNAFDEVVVFVLGVVNKILGGVEWLLSKLGKLPGQMGEDFRNMAAALDGWQKKIESHRKEIEAEDDGSALMKRYFERAKGWTEAAIAKIKGLGGAITDTGDAAGNSAVDLEALQAQLEALSGTSVDMDNMVDVGEVAMGELESAAKTAADGIADAIGDAVTESENMLRSLGRVAKRILGQIISGFVKIGIGSLIPGLGGVLGLKALGGGVVPGRGYMVGESGREAFFPDVPGKIVPERELRAAGSSLQVENLNVKVDGRLSDDPISVRRVAKMLMGELELLATYRGQEVYSNG